MCFHCDLLPQHRAAQQGQMTAAEPFETVSKMSLFSFQLIYLRYCYRDSKAEPRPWARCVPTIASFFPVVTPGGGWVIIFLPSVAFTRGELVDSGPGSAAYLLCSSGESEVVLHTREELGKRVLKSSVQSFS